MRRLRPLLAIGLLMATLLPGPVIAQGPAFDSARASLAARVSRAIDARVDELLGDPDALREWVRAAIETRPYPGIVHGAFGTFLTGAGNDVDQALLLAHMLDRSVVGHRYASCPEAFVPQVESRVGSRVAPDPALARAIADAATDVEVRDAALALPDLRAASLAATESGTTRLAALLDEHGIEIPAGPPASPPAHRHVWVQVASGTGWRDLDTTTETGEPPCTAEQTALELSADLLHTLRIQLDVETRRGDELRTSTPLSSEVPLEIAALSPVTFAFGAPDGLGARMGEVLEGRARYQPVLVVGDDIVTGTPIEALAPDGGAFGELFGPEDGEREELTGAWLRFTLTAPDGSETQLSSEVLDRIGIAARDAGSAAVAPLRELEVVGDEYAALDTIWQLAVTTGPIVVPAATTDLSLAMASGSQTTDPIDAALRLYPSLVADLGGDPIGPTLLLAGIVPISSRDGETPDTRLVLDALRVPGNRPSDPASAARDAQAVLGAERMLLDLLQLEPLALGDAASVFGAADAEGVPWTVLRPGDTAEIDGASDDALARIARQLAAGNTVITPASAPALGSERGTAWWVVDPTTGYIRDEHESGRHAVMGDHATHTARTVGWSERFRRVSCRMVGPVMLAATLWYVGSGFSTDSATLLEEVATMTEAAEENRRRGEAAREVACAGAGPG
ncbi:MAG: hypothetical protein ABWZ82_09805 [Candidatus Limnocylindrales bacterium]